MMEVNYMSKPYFLLIDQKRNVCQIPYDYEDLRDWLAYAAKDSASRITSCETNKQLIDLIRAYLKMTREEMMKED